MLLPVPVSPEPATSVQLGKVAGLHQCRWNREEGRIRTATAVKSIVGGEEEHLLVGQGNLPAEGRGELVLMLGGLGCGDGLTRCVLGGERAFWVKLHASKTVLRMKSETWP